MQNKEKVAPLQECCYALRRPKEGRAIQALVALDLEAVKTQLSEREGGRGGRGARRRRRKSEVTPASKAELVQGWLGDLGPCC